MNKASAIVSTCVAIAAGGLCGSAAQATLTRVVPKQAMDSYSIQVGNYTKQYDAPLLTGNDGSFATSTSPTLYVDFVVTAGQSGSVSMQACRLAWSGTSASCATATSGSYSAGAHDVSISVSGLYGTNNSDFDYYYASTQIGPYVTVSGVGMGAPPCW